MLFQIIFPTFPSQKSYAFLMEKVNSLRHDLINLSEVGPEDPITWKGEEKTREQILIEIGDELMMTVRTLASHGV